MLGWVAGVALSRVLGPPWLAGDQDVQDAPHVLGWVAGAALSRVLDLLGWNG